MVYFYHALVWIMVFNLHHSRGCDRCFFDERIKQLGLVEARFVISRHYRRNVPRISIHLIKIRFGLSVLFVMDTRNFPF